MTITRLRHIFINQNRNHSINTVLPTRNKFIYSCSIKIHALGFDQLLENIFCLLLFMEVSSRQKVVEMLEEVVVGWPEVRWLWQMRQNFVAQFVQLLKHWLSYVWLGVVMEKNWALPVGQCWLHALQFLVHLIYLLSILLRCNGFTRIQKAVVDQTGSSPPNSDHDLLLVHVWLWEVLWSCFLIQPLSWLSLIITYNPLFIACHDPIKKWFPVVAKNMRRWHFKMMIFWFSDSSWGIYLSSFFTFPVCFKCQTTIEWSTLSSLAASCIGVRGSALMIAFSGWLSTSAGQPLCSSSSRLSSRLQNFLNHHCTVCSLAVLGPNVLVMLRIVSAALLPIFELEKENDLNLLFV